MIHLAVKYLQLSAQNRNIRAIYKLGELHHEGIFLYFAG